MKFPLSSLPLIAALAAGSLIAAPVKIELPVETTKLKPGPGADLVTANCLICHSAEYIATQPPLPRTYWQGSVKKMQEKFGAPLAPEHVDAIVDYLATNYGAPTPPPQSTGDVPKSK